jgi:predicted N-formylglutamate amidohydrolase
LNDVPALLANDEPPPFVVENEYGRSPYLLTVDHAGARIPRKLESLGLSDAERKTHIAWDIGAAAVARLLAEQLDAWLILQTYSRLVIDCNRPPGSPESIVVCSERTRIPANEAALEPASPARAARERAIFHPYHTRLRAELAARAQRGQPTLLIAMHSFTPRYLDIQRPWHAGLLYNRDRRLADLLLPLLRALPDIVVGDNEPYSVDDDTDYTIPEHGERRGLLHVGIELRQDLIADEAGQRLWAERLAQALSNVATSIT